MNKKLIDKIVLYSILGLTVVGLGASILPPVIESANQNAAVDKAIQEMGGEQTSTSTSTSGGGSTSKGSVSKSSAAPRPTVSKDTGTLKPVRFEFEAGKFMGASGQQNANFGHACSTKSYYYDATFSNGIVIRNITTSPTHTEPNTITFNFNSDKGVLVDMTIGIACRSGKDAEPLSSAMLYTNNGYDFDISEAVVSPTNTSFVAGGNLTKYFNMTTVTVPLEIYQGSNTVVFEMSNNALNLDYFELQTSATITGFTPTYWGDVDKIITITKAPTKTSTGTLSIGCAVEGCANGTQSCTMEKLDEKYYTFKDGKYHQTICGKDFAFDNVEGGGSTSSSSAAPSSQTGGSSQQAGLKSYILPDGTDFFAPTSWVNDVDNDTPADNTNHIAADGSLKFVGGQPLLRTNLFYVTPKSDDSGWVHLADSGKSNGNFGKAKTSFSGEEYTYSFTVNPTGAFKMGFCITKSGRVDASGGNGGFYLDFTNTDIKFSSTGNADKYFNSGEISATTNALTYNAVNTIDLMITRHSSAVLSIKLKVNNTKINLAGESTTANLTTNSGNVVVSWFTSLGFGQRFGIAPSETNTVTISNLAVTHAKDTFDPTK